MKSLFKCEYCGLEVSKIPIWKKNECSKHKPQGHKFFNVNPKKQMFVVALIDNIEGLKTEYCNYDHVKEDFFSLEQMEEFLDSIRVSNSFVSQVKSRLWRLFP